MMNKLVVPLAAAAYLVAPDIAAAQQTQGLYYGPHMWGAGWHEWFLGPIMMIFFLALTVAVIVLVVRWFGGPGHGGPMHAPPGRTPLDILKERFAKGEIDKEEYEERRRVLGE